MQIGSSEIGNKHFSGFFSRYEDKCSLEIHTLFVSFSVSLIVVTLLPNTVNAPATGDSFNWNQLYQQANAIIVPPCDSLSA